MDYRRMKTPGACYFFTLVTWRRKRIFVDEKSVGILREAFKNEKSRRPFHIDAIVILPDHLHCLWQMPLGDADYSSRWREIKKTVTKAMSMHRNQRNEGDVWQPRFWEHQIRDEHDWQRHMDYIHYNPVKHHVAASPAAWPWSSFHLWVQKGGYDPAWGAGCEPEHLKAMNFE